MSGPTVLAVYTSDDGNDYKVRIPVWEASLQTPGTPTTQPQLPRGYRRRKRYYRITASGKEGSVTVLNAGEPIWADAVGTAVSIPVLGSGTSAASTWQGATGERRKSV